MQINKTHIFLRENKYTGMGGEPIEILKVHECRLPEGSPSNPYKSIYILEASSSKFSNHLKIIAEEDFQKLEEETNKVIKNL
jgi:hypothetical protein